MDQNLMSESTVDPSDTVGILFVCNLGQAFPRVPGLGNGLTKLGMPVWIVSPHPSRHIRRDLGVLSPSIHLEFSYGFSFYHSTNIFVRLFTFLRQFTTGHMNLNFGARWNHEMLLRKSRSILMRNPNIKWIFSTQEPLFMEEICRRLVEERNICWVADQLDLWSLNHVKRPIFANAMDYERSLLSTASLVTTVSPPLVDQLREVYSGPIGLLYNGFLTTKSETKALREGVQSFRIEYSGQIYSNFHDFQTPIKRFGEINRILGSNFFQLSFTGISSKQIEKHYADMDLAPPDFLILNGFVSHDAAMEMMAMADIFLVFEWEDKTFKGALSKKIFEYMSYKKPILITGENTDSEMQRILKEAGVATNLISSDDYLRLMKDLREGRLDWFLPRDEILQKYSYDSQALRLFELLTLIH